MPTIQSITTKPPSSEPDPANYFLRESLTQAELVANHGLAGDAMSKSGKRQLNVMLAETIAELAAEGFKTKPGELGEQLVIAGLDPTTIQPGMQLQLGPTAVIELAMYRTGCSRFMYIQSQPLAATKERLGFMARVITSGQIRVGDAVLIRE